jgi:hypothetical protein
MISAFTNIVGLIPFQKSNKLDTVIRNNFFMLAPRKQFNFIFPLNPKNN